MKKFVCSIALFATSFLSFAQMGSPVPVEQMKKVEFFVGAWKGTDTVSFMGQKSTYENSHASESILNGRYICSKITYGMPGSAGPMKGMHVLGYDLGKKQYVGWWFDSEEHGLVEMTGDFEGEKLVMVSKPTPMGGMGAMVMRATWTRKDADHLVFLLEMKQGDKWTEVMQGDYARTKA